MNYFKMNYSQYTALGFHTRDQAHVFHFQTTNYAEHKALDEFYSALPDLIDALIEAVQWKTEERIKAVNEKTEFKDWSSVEDSKQLVKHLEQTTAKQIEAEKDEWIKDLYIDILNHCHKTSYLLTLS